MFLGYDILIASLAAFFFLHMWYSVKPCEKQHRGIGHWLHPFVQAQYGSVTGLSRSGIFPWDISSDASKFHTTELFVERYWLLNMSRAQNSYPQLDVDNATECRYLNHASNYDAILVNCLQYHSRLTRDFASGLLKSMPGAT